MDGVGREEEDISLQTKRRGDASVVVITMMKRKRSTYGEKARVKSWWQKPLITVVGEPPYNLTIPEPGPSTIKDGLRWSSSPAGPSSCRI